MAIKTYVPRDTAPDIRDEDGVLRGYLYHAPAVAVDAATATATIDANSIYYRFVNEAIREAIAGGAKTVVLKNVNGQRYIGTGITAPGVTIKVEGTPGQDLAMLMGGPRVEVYANAQDGVANTLDSGEVIIHGSAGDVVGYGMRGGTVLVAGDVGYRVGIHMKEYQSYKPQIVCGGCARDFFGEYMAGGVLVLLGLTQSDEQPLTGGYVGTGMHGGVIYLRGTVDPYQCGKEVGIFEATPEDMKSIKPLLEKFCAEFGHDYDELVSVPFTKLIPVSARPYGNLYAPL